MSFKKSDRQYIVIDYGTLSDGTMSACTILEQRTMTMQVCDLIDWEFYGLFYIYHFMIKCVKMG